MEEIKLPSTYKQMMENSIGEKRDEFWGEWAKEITWTKSQTKILDESNPPFYKWYPDATLNITQNCLDRHIESIGDQPAFIYEGPIAGKKETWSYKRLL